jgi:hypothetical protein
LDSRKQVLRAIVRVAPLGQDETARAHAVAIERVVLDFRARGLALAPRMLDAPLESSFCCVGRTVAGASGDSAVTA